MTPLPEAVSMAYARRLAETIHRIEHTPNHPDQMRKDSMKAWSILDLIDEAGLVVRDRAALEGSTHRG